MKVLLVSLALVAAARAGVVDDVKALAMAGNFTAAQATVNAARGKSAWTGELVLAHSWLGRGALNTKQYDQALNFAAESRKLSLELLKTRKLDAEPQLPTALGASIEVTGQALARTGRLSEAIPFLQQELTRWRQTSMRARIQKNIHLLSLEGKKAPELQAKEFVGATKMKSLADFAGKPVLLFFWAHWCSDCKIQAPVLQALQHEFPSLVIVAPTQHYGYVGGGEDAPRELETRYIRLVQSERYPWLNRFAMPLDEENFRTYGSSSSPTLVLIDAKGIVRLYRPGTMSADELRPLLAKWAK